MNAVVTWRRRLLLSGFPVGILGVIGIAVSYVLLLAVDSDANVTAAFVILLGSMVATALGCDALIVRRRLQAWTEYPLRKRVGRIIGLSIAILAVEIPASLITAGIVVFILIGRTCAPPTGC